MMHIQKLGCILVFFLLVGLISTACLPINPPPAGKPATSAATQPDKTRVLEFATEHYPPFQYEENGQVRGITIDITNEIFHRMGYTTVVKIYPWVRALDMARTGEVDGTFLAFKNAERELFLDYPQEAIFLEEQAFFVRTDSSIRYDGSLESLQHYKIGIIRAYDYGIKFNAAVATGLLKTEEVSAREANHEKLLHQRIDLFLDSVDITNLLIKKTAMTDQIKQLQPPLRQENLYVAFSKKRTLSPKILAEYDRILAEMKKDGTHQAIINQYLH